MRCVATRPHARPWARGLHDTCAEPGPFQSIRCPSHRFADRTDTHATSDDHTLAADRLEAGSAAHNGFVLRADGSSGSGGGPILYDTRSGAMYGLDMTQTPDWPDFVAASTFAIVGDVVVAASGTNGWTDGMFDPRVWRLP